jgi:hypothetical protein
MFRFTLYTTHDAILLLPSIAVCWDPVEVAAAWLCWEISFSFLRR